MRAFYSNRYVIPLPAHHTFPIGKYAVIHQRLVEEGVLSPAQISAPDLATRDEILRVHTVDYYDRLLRASVVDCDVHQGNGTAAIFVGNPDVYTLSLHGEKNYPRVKQASTADVALPDGTGDDEYLERLAAHLTPAIDAFRPEIVFYQAGVDPYRGDRLGRLALSLEGLRQRDEMVLRRCRERSVPCVITLGGGYARDLADTVVAHCNTLRAARSVFAW